MGLLDWLLGRAPRQSVPMPQIREIRRVNTPREANTPPVVHNGALISRSSSNAGRPTQMLDTDEQGIAMDYNVAGQEIVRRRVRFLVGAPGALLTGIDLDKCRLRTYRRDRIAAAFDIDGNPVPDILAHIVKMSPILTKDLSGGETDRGIALTMRKAMLAPLSLLVLMARTNGDMSPKALDAIMAYARRENRFAVQEGWVPAGDKRGVWPFLRDLVLTLGPDAADLDAYVASIHDEWNSGNRFDALNQALAKVGQIDGPPTPEKLSLAAAINRIPDSGMS